MKLPLLLRLAILIFVLAPLAAWFTVRPVRVVAPTLAGVTCPSATLCVDDTSRLDEALALQTEARAFVDEKVGTLRTLPRVVFCATQACADTFGLGDRAAVTIGTFGMVMAPRAWQPHLVRHEMIHHLQAERLGTLRLLRKPTWFVEGMAYALSEDPREELVTPYQAHRQTFRQWLGGIDTRFLWAEAIRL